MGEDGGVKSGWEAWKRSKGAGYAANVWRNTSTEARQLLDEQRATDASAMTGLRRKSLKAHGENMTRTIAIKQKHWKKTKASKAGSDTNYEEPAEIYCMTTDDGGDISLAKRLLVADIDGYSVLGFFVKIVFDKPWSTMDDHGLTMVDYSRPWSTMGRPWSTMVDRG